MDNDLQRKFFYTDGLAVFFDRSPGSIRNMVARKAIPFRKVGGRLIFFLDEIEEWMDQCPGVRLEDLKKKLF